jgi:hypothetical protein
MLIDPSTKAALQEEEPQPWHVLWLIDKGRRDTQGRRTPFMKDEDWSLILKDTACSKSIGDVSFYLELVSEKTTTHIKEKLLEPVKQSFPLEVDRFTEIIRRASEEQEDDQKRGGTRSTASRPFFDDSMPPSSSEDPHYSKPPSPSRATVGSILPPTTWSPSTKALTDALASVGMTLLSEKSGGSSDCLPPKTGASSVDLANALASVGMTLLSEESGR